MLQEIYFDGEDLYQELDSMSPLFYIAQGSVRVIDSSGPVVKHAGQLLAAEGEELRGSVLTRWGG
jgi:hypothetical protein